MKGWVERWHPLVVGALAMLAFGFLWPVEIAKETRKDIYQSVLSIGSITAGFLGTALAVLFTLEGRRILKELRDRKAWRPLVDYFEHAFRDSLLLAVLSGVALLLDTKEPKPPEETSRGMEILRAAWVAGLINVVLSYRRCMYFFFRILKDDTPKKR